MAKKMEEPGYLMGLRWMLYLGAHQEGLKVVGCQIDRQSQLNGLDHVKVVEGSSSTDRIYWQLWRMYHEQ